MDRSLVFFCLPNNLKQCQRGTIDQDNSKRNNNYISMQNLHHVFSIKSISKTFLMKIWSIVTVLESIMLTSNKLSLLSRPELSLLSLGWTCLECWRELICQNYSLPSPGGSCINWNLTFTTQIKSMLKRIGLSELYILLRGLYERTGSFSTSASQSSSFQFSFPSPRGSCSNWNLTFTPQIKSNCKSNILQSFRSFQIMWATLPVTEL